MMNSVTGEIVSENARLQKNVKVMEVLFLL